MSKPKALEMKIMDRETELQRVYDNAKARQMMLLIDRDEIDRELESIKETIELCERRAEEQGCPEILEVR